MRRPSLTELPGPLLLTVILAACGQPARPSIDEWEGVWQRAKESVPSYDELAGPDGRTRCNDLLVAARELRLELLPSPDRTIDGPTEAWIHRAERIGFECPLDEDAELDLETELERLAALTAEIEAALDVEQGD